MAIQLREKDLARTLNGDPSFHSLGFLAEYMPGRGVSVHRWGHHVFLISWQGDLYHFIPGAYQNATETFEEVRDVIAHARAFVQSLP